MFSTEIALGLRLFAPPSVAVVGDLQEMGSAVCCRRFLRRFTRLQPTNTTPHFQKLSDKGAALGVALGGSFSRLTSTVVDAVTETGTVSGPALTSSYS